MAKIILLYVVALFMIFPLFWSHGNATTPRKLGVRQNAVTSLPNIGYATSGGLGYAYKLGPRQNGVTSLINTNEVIFRELKDRNSPISDLSAREVYATTTRKLGQRHSGITCFKNTNCAISGGSKSKGGSRHLYHADAVTPSILGSRQNAVASLPNTNKAASGGSEDHDSPILTSPAHTNTITIPLVDPTIFTNEANARKHGARQNPIIITNSPNTITIPLVDPTIFTNEANAGKHGARQNPIIITSLSSTNEATNTGESILHLSPISSSPTQTQFLLPRDPGSGHVYSPISSSSSHANAVTPVILGSGQNIISSSSAHTNAITIPLVDPTIFTNEANARKRRDRQNPIIITSLLNTNEVANIGESELHSSPISSSSITYRGPPRFPHDPDTRYVSSIIN